MKMNLLKSSTNIGFLSVSLGSIFLGSVGIFVRFASSNLQPMTQSFGRIFIAFLLITLLNFFRNKLKSDTFAIKKADLPFFFLNGVIGFSIMASAFTLSVLHTSITNTYFLLYTAPVFAAILSAIFLKEKISKYVITSILIAFIGLIFLFNPTNIAGNLLGNMYGLATGVSFGSYFVITGYLVRNYSSSTITFWTQFFGSLGLFPLIFIFDEPTSLSFILTDWLPVIVAGTVVLLGYFLLNYGLTKIRSSVGSILSLFEPLSSILYAFIFFSENPSKSTIIGAFFILSSITYLTFNQARVNNR